jgi:hypothetical protein
MRVYLLHCVMYLLLLSLEVAEDVLVSQAEKPPIVLDVYIETLKLGFGINTTLSLQTFHQSLFALPAS